jgi:hypothetical protein
MKVHIGPYKNRWISEVHTRYMDRKYGRYEWEDSHNRFERGLERFEDFLQSLYNKTINLYLDASRRKVKVKIHYYDTWSMDDTLAPIILPMLKQLNKSKHGAPWVDMEDVPEELRVTEEQVAKTNETGEVDDNHFARWEWVMGEMIWAFEQKMIDWEDQYTTGKYDWVFEKTEDDKYSEMKEGPNHTAVTDWEGRKAHQKRISNGFRLFGKYFESLWD